MSSLELIKEYMHLLFELYTYLVYWFQKGCDINRILNLEFT